MASIDYDPYLLEIRLHRERVSSFGEYPFDIPTIRTLSTLALHPSVTFFVGENGSGKSTLLEAIAVALGYNAEGGTRNFNFSSRASHSSLHEYLRIIRGTRRPTDGFFLRAESVFNVATEIERLEMQRSYGGRSLHEQSHGESFLAILTERLRGNGLYLFDEPEAALSPSRQLTFLSVLHSFVNAGAQCIIATHSPILLAYPTASILQFDEDGIRHTTYTETEHYQVTHAFLNRPQSMLDILLADDHESQ